VRAGYYVLSSQSAHTADGGSEWQMAAAFRGPVQGYIEAALVEHFQPTHCVVTNES